MSNLLPCPLPILQAPMAGISTPQLAAAVSAAGGLGALGLGASTPERARALITQTRALCPDPLHVNFFCHAPPARDPEREAAWIARARPIFTRLGAAPPENLREIYPSFRDEDGYLSLLLDLRPEVISFHFGLPRPAQIRALRETGATLLASATSPEEAQQIARAGLDGVIAQGWEAGGHRGIFDADAPDARLSTTALLRALIRDPPLPVIAAGGLMRGNDIRHALDLGACAAQLGTAFLACPESAASPAHRAALHSGDTTMTRVISGRPARGLRNALTDWGAGAETPDIPAYPCAYDLAKSLHTAASAQGDPGFGAHWAGTAAAQSRALPAGQLTRLLATEADLPLLCGR